MTTSDQCCLAELVVKIVSKSIGLVLRFGDFAFVPKTSKTICKTVLQNTISSYRMLFLRREMTRPDVIVTKK